jgi:hypothetical protein
MISAPFWLFQEPKCTPQPCLPHHRFLGPGGAWSDVSLKNLCAHMIMILHMIQANLCPCSHAPYLVNVRKN